jgi:hypothetical protein
MLRRVVVALFLLVCLPQFLAAQVISINFNGQGPGSPGARPGPYDLAPTDVAGVVAVPNWNNVPSDNLATPVALNSSTGAATGATVAVSGMNNAWSLPTVPATPDATMMRGYLDSGNTTTTTVTVANLPAAFTSAGYNVYVYFDGNNTTNARSGQYTIGSQMIFGMDNASTDFTGSFVQVPSTSNTNQMANTPAGNYTIFTSLTANSFTLTATPAFPATGTLRAPINAIQIVPVPEPGSIALAGIGMVSLLGYRLRRRAGKDLVKA